MEKKNKLKKKRDELLKKYTIEKNNLQEYIEKSNIKIHNIKCEIAKKSKRLSELEDLIDETKKLGMSIVEDVYFLLKVYCLVKGVEIRSYFKIKNDIDQLYQYGRRYETFLKWYAFSRKYDGVGPLSLLVKAALEILNEKMFYDHKILMNDAFPDEGFCIVTSPYYDDIERRGTTMVVNEEFRNVMKDAFQEYLDNNTLSYKEEIQKQKDINKKMKKRKLYGVVRNLFKNYIKIRD